jgi:ubiquinone/menaquinone biosynthesis C-methylase UbiE
LLKRLHWGCGPITPYGWINSDIYPHPGVDVPADILAGLPLPANEFDYVVAIHALPEIPIREQQRAIGELHRVLKPGGVLRLGLPDMDKAIRAYLSKDIDYFFLIPDEMASTISGKMITQLLWYSISRCMFTAEFATELVTRSGFRQVQICRFRETKSEHPGIVELDDREMESFFVEATK